jgi:hypothetical protein
MKNGRQRQPQGEKGFGMGMNGERGLYSAALGRMASTCFSVMAAGCPWYRTIPLASTSIT